ncbi:hypothetical protein GCM10020295_32640 [Streptomyces cinereospinus]
MHPLLVRDLWRAMGGADVVHVHAGRDLVTLAALAVAVLRRRPFVAQTHGMVQPRHTAVARLFDRLYVPLLRRARACLVLTGRERAAVAEVVGDGGPPLVILPNGVRPGHADGAGRTDGAGQGVRTRWSVRTGRGTRTRRGVRTGPGAEGVSRRRRRHTPCGRRGACR